ncbi:MAG: hypothetical protein K2I42_01325 [Anaeroplasmataceae bacterium]|nr:hypothetical protein [Anaeroplasmataceae bacterium]
MKIKRAFSFFYKNKIYCVFNGMISKRKTDYFNIYLKKMPMDLKHKIKLDYSVLINKLKKNR